MLLISSHSMTFTTEYIYSTNAANQHTYKVVIKNNEGKVLRIDYLTAIDGVAIKLNLQDLTEEGDTHPCAEVFFELNGDYDKVDHHSRIRIRATKWLLATWKDAKKDEFKEFYCEPYEDDDNGDYRTKIFGKLGFVNDEDFGMMILR